MFLNDMAKVLQQAGLIVVTYPGWETRSTPSKPNGYDATPSNIVIHHTASPTNTTPTQEVAFMLKGTDTTPPPIGHILLDRMGIVHIIAAGVANHAGKGGPLNGVPLNSMNSKSIGIEASNNGRGEEWPFIQQAVYTKLCAVLCKHYKIPTSSVFAHFEWAPTRKIDPFGPSRFTMGEKRKWDMALFRAEVKNHPIWNPVIPPVTDASFGSGGELLYFVRPAGKPGPMFVYNGIVKKLVTSDEEKNLLSFLFNAQMSGDNKPVELSEDLLNKIPTVR